MVEEAVETRIKSSPSVGAKISLLIAGLFVVMAVYSVVVPLSVPIANGGKFDCRSAIEGPRTELAKSTCGNVYRVGVTRGIAWAAGGVLVAAGGFVAFGLVRRKEYVRVSSQAHDDVDGRAGRDEESSDESAPREGAHALDEDGVTRSRRPRAGGERAPRDSEDDEN